MKKILFVTICFLSVMLSIASADVYLTYNKSDNEVVDMSVREDVVMKKDWTRVKLPGRLTDYPLQYAPHYYKYQGERFIVNVKKLSDEAIAQEQVFKKQKFEQQLFDEYAPTHESLMQYYLIVGRCIDYNNDQGWGTLKAYIDSLLKGEKIIQKDYDDFVQILKDNYIDLEQYT